MSEFEINKLNGLWKAAIELNADYREFLCAEDEYKATPLEKSFQIFLHEIQRAQWKAENT